ncbi:MAG: (Fe-S)-binding protein [Nitratireductor sp.]|nr:(Fe-S)-binding protein [Nitratireductor sp.]MCC0020724.1 (Fe-S)-binding protein [Nitratireductor sp.]
METGYDTSPRRVGLFVTCLVDLFRPTVGFAAARLLEEAGCEVYVPVSQTCCGQPAYNSGDRADTAEIAKQVIEAFEEFDYIVAPSGSCAGMLKKHYPELFEGDPKWSARVEAFSAKVHELVSFLTDIRGVERVNAKLDAVVTYHDSCSGLRELGVKDQPRKLLASVEGVTIKEMKDPNVCCGFGGTFAVKYTEVSNAIVSAKTSDIKSSGAELLLAGDMGCLMNMAGKLRREKSSVEVRHIAEVLAGMTSAPPIGGKGDR